MVIRWSVLFPATAELLLRREIQHFATTALPWPFKVIAVRAVVR